MSNPPKSRISTVEDAAIKPDFERNLPLLNRLLGTGLGLVSISLSALIPIHFLRPAAFPYLNLTDSVVIVAGLAGGSLAAVSAGLIGSSKWFLAILGTAADVVFLWRIKP